MKKLSIGLLILTMMFICGCGGSKPKKAKHDFPALGAAIGSIIGYTYLGSNTATLEAKEKNGSDVGAEIGWAAGESTETFISNLNNTEYRLNRELKSLKSKTVRTVIFNKLFKSSYSKLDMGVDLLLAGYEAKKITASEIKNVQQEFIRAKEHLEKQIEIATKDLELQENSLRLENNLFQKNIFPKTSKIKGVPQNVREVEKNIVTLKNQLEQEVGLLKIQKEELKEALKMLSELSKRLTI